MKQSKIYYKFSIFKIKFTASKTSFTTYLAGLTLQFSLFSNTPVLILLEFYLTSTEIKFEMLAPSISISGLSPII